MAAVPFDTLKFSERLKAGGFSEQQAKAEAFADATAQDLVTRADLKAETAVLKAGMADLKADLLKWLVPLLLGQAALVKML